MNDVIQDNQELPNDPVVLVPQIDPETGLPVIIVPDEEAVRTTEAEEQPVI